MNIREKVLLDVEGLRREGPVTVVAFGDSVTHGAVAAGEMDYDSVYWNRFRLLIQERYPYVPVNVINAGIGGDSAPRALGRMEDQVLRHRPDLVIVCFGLNDVNLPKEDYLSALGEIFRRLKAAGVEAVFLTPNMLNTTVAEDTAEEHLSYAAVTAAYQNEGRMDEYMDAAVAVAREAGVIVADAYAEWKAMEKAGVDTTALLANRINHPTREMHALFARLLMEAVFPERGKGDAHSTMFEGK